MKDQLDYYKQLAIKIIVPFQKRSKYKFGSTWGHTWATTPWFLLFWKPDQLT